MNKEQETLYNAMVRKINKMSNQKLDALIAADKCPFEPEHLMDMPLGMFHCPVCGQMVLAGLAHPRTAKENKNKLC